MNWKLTLAQDSETWDKSLSILFLFTKMVFSGWGSTFWWLNKWGQMGSVKVTLLASDNEENESQTFQFQVKSHITISCCLKNTCPLKRIITNSLYSKTSEDKRINSWWSSAGIGLWQLYLKCEMAQKTILKEFSLLLYP